MNLESLMVRAQEIEQAILQTMDQLKVLNGHKGETAHWIKQLQDSLPEDGETPVEAQVEPVVQ